MIRPYPSPSEREEYKRIGRFRALRAGSPHFSPASQGQFGASRPLGSSTHNVSNPIQLISIGTPADQHSANEIRSYLFSAAAGREVVSFLHLAKCHDELWRAAHDLGWEPRECFPSHERMQASYLSACLGAVFGLVESASRFPAALGVCAKVVVVCFELSDSDLLLLRLIGKIQSPYLEVGAQMPM